jgi:glycosyltransferase involved in cell wall biosynthesis
MRQQWGILPTETLIGYPARIDPVKDHRLILRAAAKMAAQQPHLRFAIVGEGAAEYVGDLQREARALGIGDRILWAGVAEDMVAVYNALDLTVSTSASEGFSNCVAEALSCGCACVVTDVGDSALIVGDGALVVTARDPDAFAAACLRAVQQRRDAEWYARRIRQEFSVDRMVHRTEAALLDVVRRSPGANS